MFILKQQKMLKDIVTIIKDVALKHKGVHTFKYQADDLNNQQNNHKYYQVYLDDVSMHQLNITTNVFRSEFNLYILGFPDKTEESILETQNNAYTIAADIIAYIDGADEYKGVLSVHDYSMLVLSHYSDDNAAGVKLSLVLSMPSPVNLCDLDDNFNDEPYEPEPEKEIYIDDKETGEIDIKPITLKPNRRC